MTIVRSVDLEGYRLTMIRDFIEWRECPRGDKQLRHYLWKQYVSSREKFLEQKCIMNGTPYLSIEETRWEEKEMVK